MKIKQALIGLFGFCSAIAIAQTQLPPRLIETPGIRVEVLGGVPQGAHRVDVSQSRLIVYSAEDLRLPGATAIFVNGSFHTSLVNGAYSDLCHSPGKVELDLRQVEVGKSPKDHPDSVFDMQMAGGQTYYLRVREQNGRPALQAVGTAQAERELTNKRLQIHNISRVAQKCIEVAPAPVVVVAPPPVVAPPKPPAPAPARVESKRHTLAADTMFAIGRSDRNGMTSEGLRIIDRLVGQLTNVYSRIDSMTIIGHADPMGNTAMNERLAQERAETVRDYIQSKAKLRTPITAVGRGSREPVITTCGRLSLEKAIKCNLPNRRVEIEITGLRR